MQDLYTTGSSPRIKFPGEKCYTYRIELLDKCGSGYSLDKPKQFLSPKAIERRRRLGLKVDSTDLPVSYVYMRQIASDVVRIIGTSKWNNTVLINCTDTTQMHRTDRPKKMSVPEIMLIMILFHSSGYRCLKHLYLNEVCGTFMN